ncbi:NAD(P)/FAD-dependent oxidoreductase [candidate division WS5 bacterium]|jgi:flavin-dependent dehydrogenase|uniref:NAD(P)/FAD-dependent oxidoreductase n=1 Tax=candidate division WS5 bacterium TaxID=2093353 RepID=A0A419DAN3_9BACT|nr:MAG: NAD(P)/FAD-dependent oxidoreductase [candidate division WS5 bacterium]
MYDLIVAGAGPAGLMAAKTAAEDGMKVLLLERKREISRITRDCAQVFYVADLTFDRLIRKFKPLSNGYIEPVAVEVLLNKCRFHFLVPGFTVDYSGPLRAYYNKIHLSPGGHKIFLYPPNERLWGFFFDKETFNATLLAGAVKAGTEVVNETLVLGAANVNRRVEVLTEHNSKSIYFKARHLIAAEGRASRIVESLGLNKERITRKPRHRLSFIMEGIEAPYTDNSYFACIVPSISPTGNIGLCLNTNGRNRLGVGSSSDKPPAAILEEFMKLPAYRPWFAHARIVSKLADGSVWRAPIRDPVIGNVIIAGDAGGPETWIQGAVACGYQAVKAIEKEMSGQKGFAHYTTWWQNAFQFNKKKTFGTPAERPYPLDRVNSDEEVDFLFKLCEGKIGPSSLVIGDNLEAVKETRPELYSRLKRSEH